MALELYVNAENAYDKSVYTLTITPMGKPPRSLEPMNAATLTDAILDTLEKHRAPTRITLAGATGKIDYLPRMIRMYNALNKFHIIETEPKTPGMRSRV